jgi:hypothetical protein
MSGTVGGVAVCSTGVVWIATSSERMDLANSTKRVRSYDSI